MATLPLAVRVTGLARRNPALLVVAGITVVGALIRFSTLGDQSFNHDETVTAARVLHGGFLNSMQVVVNGERSPPLYYALAWPWSRIFGIGEVGLRSLSATAGTLTIPLAYLAARELASRRAGFLAAGLVALDPYLIWYSQEARSYAMLVAFGALGLWLFARSLRDPSRRNLAGWAVASALALSTHYFAVFAILPEALLLLTRVRPWRRLLAPLAAIVCVGAALLPLAIVQEGSGRSNNFARFPVAQRAETAIVKYVGSEGPAPEGGIQSTTPFQRDAAVVGVALFASAVGIGLSRGGRRERSGLLVAGGVAAAAFTAPLLLAWGGLDFVDPRNMIGALLPALVAAAIGFSAQRAIRVGPVAAVAASVLFVVVVRAVDTTPALQRNDWRAGVAAAPSGGGPELYVVPADGRSPVEYYSRQRLPKFLPKRFRDGIATRRIVVISDAPDIRRPARGFRPVSTRIAPQHWTVKTFASRRPLAVRPSQLMRRNVLPREPWTSLVAQPRRLRALEAGVDRRQSIEASVDRAGRKVDSDRGSRPEQRAAA